MIHLGENLSINFKNNILSFGRSNRSGNSEKQIILALLSDKYYGDEEQIIYHIISSRSNKPINKSNIAGIGGIIHNYQFMSKDTSDFVIQFKLLPIEHREKVLYTILNRNKKRDEDCKSYDEECPHHRSLVNIGIKQYEKLEGIHSMMILDIRSKLHLWKDPTIKFTEKQRTRLSKKEKKQLKKKK